MLIDILLLILSVLVYAYFGLENLIYILFSTLTSFFTAKYAKGKNKKIFFILTILINTVIFIFFKIHTYVGFIGLSFENIIVPLGISYYTLKIISYLIDVYKEKYEAENNLFKYFLYVIYLPTIFIGPIPRYNEMSNILFQKRKIKADNIYNGGIRIIWGLFKKYVIAGRVGILIATISGNVETYSGAYALFAMLLYSLQLYSDFSGGIDIVIGASKIVGIPLKENFNLPFLAETVQDFWRRWHIALSSWLKDYIYIPLGGSRCSKIRHKINLIITFIVSGFWHGTTYIFWGLFHGIIVAFNDLIKTKWKTINRIITFLIVSILWSFFIWTDNWLIPLQMIGSIFTKFNYGELFTNFLNLGLDLSNIIVLIISTAMLIIFDLKKDKIIDKIKKYSPEFKTAIVCSLILIICVFGIYGIGFDANQFIYSRF